MTPATAPRPSTVSLAGDFDGIYRDHAPFVYRTAWGVLGSREDAEDVVQTVFLKLLQRESPVEIRTNPGGYLYRAAVNVALDILKARCRVCRHFLRVSSHLGNLGLHLPRPVLRLPYSKRISG